MTASSTRRAATRWHCWSCPTTQPARLAGQFELPDALQVPQRVEEGFQRRSAGLPAETQLLLLLAATDPTGEAAVLWRAAAHLGVAPGRLALLRPAGCWR